jgi:DNA-binding CsgD family transcriptional regulator
MAEFESYHDYASDERYATLRGRYLSKTTDLRLKEATAVAWSELGYSIGGIAKEMDTNESTVQAYHEKAIALYGLEILETIIPEAEDADYERIDAEYVLDLPRPRKKDWKEAFNRQRDSLPQEWVASVDPEST